MKIKMLVENTSISTKYQKRHGLSLYIETKSHKLLFDLGPDDSFLKNAKKLQVDIAAIDTVVISHGHYDHGGALKTFLEHNQTATIYVQKDAFEPHYSKFAFLKFFVGLDAALKNHERIVLVDTILSIDNELLIFSGVTEKALLPQGNQALLTKRNGNYIQDDFLHEQHLLVHDHGFTALFAGCSHSGILNIIEKALTYTDTIDYVVAGLHLFNPVSRKVEHADFISQIALKLKKYNMNYYTCHCTGQKAFQMLKKELNEQMHYLSTGEIIDI